MKRVLSALALATCAALAQAQVTFVDGTERSVFANYNPNGAAGTLGPVVGGREDSMINTTAGILTATFLGFEAIDTDTFTFTLSSGTLSNKGALNASISGAVAAGPLNFTFADMFQGRPSATARISATSRRTPSSARSPAACSRRSPSAAHTT